MDINFTCTKCGNTTYFIANNEYENILICKKCCESHFMSYRKLKQKQYKPHCPICKSYNVKRKASNYDSTFRLSLVMNRRVLWICNDCKITF